MTTFKAELAVFLFAIAAGLNTLTVSGCKYSTPTYISYERIVFETYLPPIYKSKLMLKKSYGMHKYISFRSSMLDIAPDYAGIVFGISNTVRRYSKI